MGFLRCREGNLPALGQGGERKPRNRQGLGIGVILISPCSRDGLQAEFSGPQMWAAVLGPQKEVAAPVLLTHAWRVGGPRADTDR